jgi:hypothetical protein
MVLRGAETRSEANRGARGLLARRRGFRIATLI